MNTLEAEDERCICEYGVQFTSQPLGTELCREMHTSLLGNLFLVLNSEQLRWHLEFSSL
jgi:hypothetical protein